MTIEHIIIAIIALCTLIFHIRYTTITAYKAPAFLTTLGILGTFIGIGFGLLHFDASNIQASVPYLIGGIKTAIWASAAGIFCALTIKFRDIFFGNRKKITAQGASGATVDDLASILTAVQQALVGNDDSTLLSQMKLARQDSNDRLDRLSRSMDEFCTKVAESNSKALIEALKEVIRDFNAKINEQFGDNFKQLNQAVGKLLEWQEHYRVQMGDMIEQQSITSQNMAVSSERYHTLVKQSEIFNGVAESLYMLLNALETQRNQFEGSLSSLAKLIESAASGLPQIEMQITQIATQLQSSVTATNEEFKKMLLNVVHQSNDEFNTHIRSIIEKTKEQVTVLDTALGEELTKSLETFGKQLASLSRQFALDYTPITENLQKVIRMAG
jgi:DNA anti-recombination protein RmuC